jgi:lipopolysaccharide transport system permease protein
MIVEARLSGNASGRVTLGGFVTLLRYGSLIGRLVARDVQARYRGSVVGAAWTLLQPLLVLALFTFVFAEVLKVRLGPEVGTASFPLFLFCGILPWQALQETLSRSAGTLFEHTALVKRNLFPVEVLPLAVAAAGLVPQAVGTAILGVALTVSGHGLCPAVAVLPVLFVLQFLLAAGLGWALAALNVFVRDIGQLLGLVLMLWVFLTPIFYPASAYPPRFAFLLAVNPLALLVEAHRDILLRGVLPGAASLGALATVAVLTFTAGHWLFQRLRPGFADLL